MFFDARLSGNALNTITMSRLIGPTTSLVTSSTNAESGGAGSIGTAFENNITFKPGIGFDWWCGFGRAFSFFDQVCYTGSGSAMTVAHNLGVVPELMVIKSRTTGGNREWVVYSKSIAIGQYLYFTSAAAGSNTYWNGTAPTASVFSIDGSTLVNNSPPEKYVAYLFATCAGVSKVGSYSGNTGATVTVPCGFTGGVRWVMIKRTDSTGDWYIWDSARGIVAGNDPYLLLNTTAAQVTSTDYVDTISTGFEVTSTAPAALNATGGPYIFLAIA